MNPDKQRIAIAEACGWTDCHLQNEGGRYFEFDCTGTPPNWSGRRYEQIPNYPADLNAMHEAVITLDFDQLADMAEYLGVDADDAPADSWNTLLRATAAQRAEAFLRTIGKWEEGP